MKTPPRDAGRAEQPRELLTDPLPIDHSPIAPIADQLEGLMTARKGGEAEAKRGIE